MSILFTAGGLLCAVACEPVPLVIMLLGRVLVGLGLLPHIDLTTSAWHCLHFHAHTPLLLTAFVLQLVEHAQCCNRDT